MVAKGVRRRILLVDDEDDLRVTLRMLLQIEFRGVEVVESRSADDALKRFGQEHFDLVISDYQMPGMDGLEFLGHWRSVRPHVPRVMMTASSEIFARKTDVADRLFHKPFEAEPFIQEIKRLFTSGPRSRTPASSPSWPAA